MFLKCHSHRWSRVEINGAKFWLIALLSCLISVIGKLYEETWNVVTELHICMWKHFNWRWVWRISISLKGAFAEERVQGPIYTVLGTGDNPLWPFWGNFMTCLYEMKLFLPGLLKPFYISQCTVILLPLAFFSVIWSMWVLVRPTKGVTKSPCCTLLWTDVPLPVFCCMKPYVALATRMINLELFNGKAWWPHGLCARLQIKWSGFEPWLGTLCCVVGQDT